MPVTDNEMAEFYCEFTAAYGYSDVQTAIEKFQEVGLSASALAGIVKKYTTNVGTDQSVDVCFVAYEYILGMARSKISDVLGFDVCNDIKGDVAFSTAGNYMATTWDYSQEAIDQLTEKLETTNQESIDILSENIFIKVFLEGVGIDTKKFVGIQEV